MSSESNIELTNDFKANYLHNGNGFDEKGFNNILFLETNYNTNYETPKKEEPVNLDISSRSQLTPTLTPKSNNSEIQFYLTKDLINKIEENTSPLKSIKSDENNKKFYSKEIYLLDSNNDDSYSSEYESKFDIENKEDNNNLRKSDVSLLKLNECFKNYKDEDSLDNDIIKKSNYNINNNEYYGSINYLQYQSNINFNNSNLITNNSKNEYSYLVNNTMNSNVNQTLYRNNMYLSNEDKFTNRKIVENSFGNTGNNKFNNIYTTKQCHLKPSSNINQMFNKCNNPYTEIYPAFMYGKQGWICITCKNFNYESIYLLI